MNRGGLVQRLTGPGALRLFLASTVVVQHFSHLHLGLWAVYTFFILSGYWISVMYRKKYRAARAPALTFWCSRYLRLLPVYLSCIALAMLILRLSSKHWTELNLVHDPLWLTRTLLIVSSSRQIQLIGAAWSLDIEMQFYLLAPLLLLAMARARVTPAILAVLAMAVIGTLIWKTEWLPRYLALFLAGSLIDRSRWRPKRGLALASVAAFVVIVSALLLNPAWRQMVIFPSVQPSDPVRALNVLLAFITVPMVAYVVGNPSDAVDRHAGDLAYCVYLFHPCVYMVASYLAGFNSPARQLISHWLWLLVLPGSIALYLLVDRPAEVLRKRFVEARVRKGRSDAQYSIAEPVGI
jgi:peptidoglycan/LPS O-acetylase OafA/YrhL